MAAVSPAHAVMVRAALVRLLVHCLLVHWGADSKETIPTTLCHQAQTKVAFHNLWHLPSIKDQDLVNRIN